MGEGMGGGAGDFSFKMSAHAFKSLAWQESWWIINLLCVAVDVTTLITNLLSRKASSLGYNQMTPLPP